MAVVRPLSEEMSVEALDKEFSRIWQDLVDRPETGAFRQQLSLLDDAWKRWKQIQNSQRKKLQDLRTKMVVSRARVLATATRTKEDQATIVSLKKELEKAWKMVDEQHDMQRQSHENIESLRLQVENLLRANKRSAGLEVTNELITELKAANIELTAERDQLLTRVTALEELVASKDRIVENLQNDKASALSSLSEVRDQLCDARSFALKETHARELAESDCKRANVALDTVKLELEVSQKALVEGEHRLVVLHNNCSSLQVGIEKAQKEGEAEGKKLKKLRQEHEDQHEKIVHLSTELRNKTNCLKSVTEEVELLTSESIRFNKTKESLLSRIKFLNDKKTASESRADNLQAQVLRLEKEATKTDKLMDEERKKVDALLRDRDTLAKQVTKGCRQRQEMTSSLALLHSRFSALTDEVSTVRGQLTRSQSDTNHHQREKHSLQTEICQLKNEVSTMSENLRSLNVDLLDCRKKLTDAQRQLEQRRAAHEALESDRNLLAKSLSESQDECSDLKRKLKHALHQTERLKEDCNCKDVALVRCEQEHRRLEKELQALSQEVLDGKQSVSEAQNSAKQNESRHRKVLQEVGQVKEQLRRQQLEIDKSQHERRNLETRVAQRAEEVQRLQSELRDTRSALDKNKITNSKNIDDIRFLRLEVRRLRSEREVLRKSVTNTSELRVEVFRSHKELLQERVKNKALEEEMEHPINVHRWRELEGKDPTALELLQKVQILQKRVILQNEGLAGKMFTQVDPQEDKLPKKPEGPQRNETAVSASRDVKSQALLIKSLQSQLRVFEDEATKQCEVIEILRAQLQSKSRNLHSQQIRLPHRNAVSANPLAVVANRNLHAHA